MIVRPPRSLCLDASGSSGPSPSLPRRVALVRSDGHEISPDAISLVMARRLFIVVVVSRCRAGYRPAYRSSTSRAYRYPPRRSCCSNVMLFRHLSVIPDCDGRLDGRALGRWALLDSPFPCHLRSCLSPFRFLPWTHLERTCHTWPSFVISILRAHADTSPNL